MASLREREGSKFWFGCFTLPGGRRVQRSTKTTDRKRAQQIADKWEAVTRAHATARQTQRVIADIYRDLTGNLLEFPTVREYFDKWVEDKRSETRNSTFVFYRHKAQRFLKWLGSRADEHITLIDREDIKKFREFEMKRVSWRSARHAIKFLRMVFKSAKEDGKYHEENPAAGVKVGEQDGVRRRGFKIPEIRLSTFGGSSLDQREYNQSTTAYFLCLQYAENEIAADKKYRGRIFTITGYIKTISVEGETAVVELFVPLWGIGKTWYMRCYFNDTSGLEKYQGGYSISFTGTVGGINGYTLEVKDCHLLR